MINATSHTIRDNMARYNMVEQQLRPAEVLDPRILDIFGQAPRDAFVPDAYKALAYSDINIPLGHGEVMMKPIQEARMLQALDVQPQDKILEIGTGSGYVTSLLAELGKHVISVEIQPDLRKSAEQTLKSQGITNVTLETGDAAQGWKSQAPYDVIAVTGSMPLLADELKQQLNKGGRLFVITGTAPAMTALLITRIGDDEWSEESLFETELPVLQNARQPPAFVF